MITNSGKRVFPKGHKLHDPTGLPTLSDIAIGLSRQVRFAGQTNQFYSVLAHTMVVAALVEPEFRKAALLHDAPEAIVSDIPTPWKAPAMREHEGRLYASLASVHEAQQEIPDEVHAADVAALKAEAHLLGHAACEEFWPVDGFDGLAVKAMILTHEAIAIGFSDAAMQDAEWAIDAYTSAFEV